MPAQKRAPESSEDDPLKLDHGCSTARPEDEDADGKFCFDFISLYFERCRSVLLIFSALLAFVRIL